MPIGENTPLCRRCARVEPSYDRVRSLYEYGGAVKKSIIAFKFQGKRELAEALAALMTEYYEIELAGEKVDFIVPVPLHSERELGRGFNQSLSLAEFIGIATGVPVSNKMIKRVRATETMNKLGRAQRFRNMEGAFNVIDRSIVDGRQIMLLDDVITTGATLDECAGTLKRCGAKRVICLTLARTIRRKQHDGNFSPEEGNLHAL